MTLRGLTSPHLRPYLSAKGLSPRVPLCELLLWTKWAQTLVLLASGWLEEVAWGPSGLEDLGVTPRRPGPSRRGRAVQGKDQSL